MPDETPDPGATRASAEKPAPEPEPEPAPAQRQAFNLAELEALRSRLIAKSHGRR